MEKVIHAVPHNNYHLEIEFNTGEKKCSMQDPI